MENHRAALTMTLRDAMHVALTFDIYNRHANKIAMANIAQTINCLHSLFAAHEDKYVRTPVFHTFEMYRTHMGARLVPTRFATEVLTVPILEGTATLPRLSGSASVKSGVVTLTLTNPSAESPVTVRVRSASGGISEALATVTHAELQAANTFDKPGEVKPAPLSVTASGGAAALVLPPRSVVAVQLRTS